MKKQNIYTVAQVNSYIKNMFTQDFLLNSLSIKGEISNCKYHSSGHIYFTLKDQKGTLACVMFAGNRNGLNFSLQEGQQVVVQGSVDVYERDGKYQLYAKEISLDGTGNLYEKFEQLKSNLLEMGMFDQEYKRPIPKIVQTLGIVTAPTGAAVQDIINIAKRRNPYLQIILYPAIVQGEVAATSIVNGIQALQDKNVDVIIVGRGGGSIEDLWAFNEEIVAHAIFSSHIPIISAVGHETDTTIADYVADLRAPTPSAAAELAICDMTLLLEQIKLYQRKFIRVMNERVRNQYQIIENYSLKLQRLSPKNQLRQKQMHAIWLEETMQKLMEKQLLQSKHQMAIFIEKLKGLSPLDKLSHGYAFVTNEQDEMLNSIHSLKVGDSLKVHMTDGEIKAKMISKEEIRRKCNE